MSNYEIPSQDPHDIDDQLDRLVDVENLSYDDARRKLGLPPADNSDFTADAIRSRLGPAAMGEFDDPEAADDIPPHDGTNPKHGLNKKAWQEAMQDPEAYARKQRGVELVRQAMRGSRKD